MTFSGVYPKGDITFLLQPTEVCFTSVEEKERLIQSGEKHYSEMLSQEPVPSETHLTIYQSALDSTKQKISTEVMELARILAFFFKGQPIALASLVRAGVPLGVLLTKALKSLNYPVEHFGISIIRDKGLDNYAMDLIESKYPKDNIVFVDGWTGKGAISKQLKHSLEERGGYPQIPRLTVLADIYGSAWLSASKNDWLIPFGILGAPISGLVSRSIWLENGFHGCMFCDHLKEYDRSNIFIDTITDLFNSCNDSDRIPNYLDKDATYDLKLAGMSSHSLQTKCDDLILKLQVEYNIDKVNRIKPGIAEATRAILRRIPEHILIRDKSDPNISLIMHLAEIKNIEVTELGDQIAPYHAITIIKKVN